MAIKFTHGSLYRATQSSYVSIRNCLKITSSVYNVSKFRHFSNQESLNIPNFDSICNFNFYIFHRYSFDIKIVYKSAGLYERSIIGKIGSNGNWGISTPIRIYLSEILNKPRPTGDKYRRILSNGRFFHHITGLPDNIRLIANDVRIL